MRRVASRGQAERLTMAGMWAVLFGIGVSLEVLGLLVTASGIWTTWQANAQGEALTAPVVAWAQRTGWRLNDRLPRRWRRSRPVTLHPASGSIGVISGTAGVARGWSPLPVGLTTEEVLAELEKRIRAVHDQYQEADNKIRTGLLALQHSDDALGKRVDQVEGQVTETARLLRVEGLRWQAVGIGFLAFGLVLQSVGQAGM